MSKLDEFAATKPAGWKDWALKSGKVHQGILHLPTAPAPTGDIDDALDATIRRVTGQAPCRGCGR